MNTQISSRQQLETVLNEIMKIYKPQSGILTRLAETYLGWIFGLIASFVIYHFNIHGWGLVFLVYVLVFEILNLGLSWGSALYTKYEKYEHLRIYRMTQLLILVLAVWGSFMFAFEWKIPIQYACFVVVWIVKARALGWRPSLIWGLCHIFRERMAGFYSKYFAPIDFQN